MLSETSVTRKFLFKLQTVFARKFLSSQIFCLFTYFMHDPRSISRNEFVKILFRMVNVSKSKRYPNGVLINLPWMIFQFSFQQIKNLFDFFVMI